MQEVLAERVLKGDRATQEIDVMDWLGGTRSATVTEEVVGLGRYGKTLTVLSSSAIGRGEDGLTGDDNDDVTGLPCGSTG